MIRKLPRPTEHAEQVAVIQWAELQLNVYPELWLLHAIPNAGAGAQRGQAGKMKAEGVKPGVPDLALPVRRAGILGGAFAVSSGLYIEMKRIGEKATPAQRAWLEALKEQGFETHVAQGADEAIALLRKYLSRPRAK